VEKVVVVLDLHPGLRAPAAAHDVAETRAMTSLQTFPAYMSAWGRTSTGVFTDTTGTEAT
jgi:hypothetical protein